MIKTKILKLILLMSCFIFILSMNCFADDEPDWDAVSLSEGSAVLNKARQAAARRSASISALKALDGVDGVNHPDYKDDGYLNNVNLTAAYLFADECCYPFSYFNWPSVANKDQLYIWIKMKNNLKHADWTCVETEITNRECGGDHDEDYECHYDEGYPTEEENPTSEKCDQQAWKPKLNFSFGRYFKSKQAASLGYSQNSSTYLQNGGWYHLGSLLYYGVFWSPVSKAGPGGNYDPLGINTLGDYALTSGSLYFNRVFCKNEQLIEEVKQYGSGGSGTEAGD